MNLISPVQLSEQQLFSAFLSVLKGNGLTLVKLPSGTYKIITDKDASKSYTAVNGKETDDVFITRIFTVDFIDTIDVRDAVKPYVHKYGEVFALKGSSTLIVSDYAQNLIKIAKPQIIGF